MYNNSLRDGLGFTVVLLVQSSELIFVLIYLPLTNIERNGIVLSSQAIHKIFSHTTDHQLDIDDMGAP